MELVVELVKGTVPTHVGMNRFMPNEQNHPNTVPTHVGMNLMIEDRINQILDCPHTRGDEP